MKWDLLSHLEVYLKNAVAWECSSILPLIKKILMGDTTPLINAVWSKLKCSMAFYMHYNKEMYLLQSSYKSRNVLIFFLLVDNIAFKIF